MSDDHVTPVPVTPVPVWAWPIYLAAVVCGVLAVIAVALVYAVCALVWIIVSAALRRE
jgi:hypothetical protein